MEHESLEVKTKNAFFPKILSGVKEDRDCYEVRPSGYCRISLHSIRPTCSTYRHKPLVSWMIRGTGLLVF